MTVSLTRRQRDVFEYLCKHVHADRHPPTLDELAQGLHLRSRGSLHKHVRALVDAGLIEPLGQKQRGVRLTAARVGAGTRIPLLGRVAAGSPIEALQIDEDIEIPASMADGRACYALRVRGDSMVDEGIQDGDLVVLESREYAQDGEIVVALIDGENATLKRYQRRGETVTLIPANPALQPLNYPAERVSIRGILKALLRTY